jgi:hypothetical protein
MPDFRAGTPWGEALRALDPILAAEKERGNRGRVDLGDARDNRPGFRMLHPLDVNALKVQFEFGDGIEITQGAPAGLQFRGRGGGVVFALGGGEPGGWIDGWRRRRWWRKWSEAPRAKEPFANPFAQLNA